MLGIGAMIVGASVGAGTGVGSGPRVGTGIVVGVGNGVIPGCPSSQARTDSPKVRPITSAGIEDSFNGRSLLDG